MSYTLTFCTISPTHPLSSDLIQNPVGIGQYDLDRWHNYQHKNASENVFSSGTPRLPVRVDTPRELLLKERLYPKGISATRRLFQAAALGAPC